MLLRRRRLFFPHNYPFRGSDGDVMVVSNDNDDDGDNAYVCTYVYARYEGATKNIPMDSLSTIFMLLPVSI